MIFIKNIKYISTVKERKIAVVKDNVCFLIIKISNFLD